MNLLLFFIHPLSDQQFITFKIPVMKMQNFYHCFNPVFSSYGISQNLKYDELVREAWELYEAKDYPKSAAAYKDAFDQIEGKAYQRRDIMLPVLTHLQMIQNKPFIT